MPDQGCSLELIPLFQGDSALVAILILLELCTLGLKGGVCLRVHDLQLVQMILQVVHKINLSNFDSFILFRNGQPVFEFKVVWFLIFSIILRSLFLAIFGFDFLVKQPVFRRWLNIKTCIFIIRFKLFERWLGNTINSQPFSRREDSEMLFDELQQLFSLHDVDANVDTPQELKDEFFRLLRLYHVVQLL